MKISSTEFQQRVGYYLSLVEKGVEVIIERKKPGEAFFVLSLQIPVENKQDASKLHEDWLKKLWQIPFDAHGEDCVDFQHRVRQ